MKPFWLGLLLALAAASAPAADMQPVYKLSAADFDARLDSDAQAVLLHRAGLAEVNHFLQSKPAIFPESTLKDPRLMRRGEKEEAWAAWQRFLDYMLALESVQHYYRPYYRLKGAAKEDAFLVEYAAMLARYRAALEFIDRAERNPELDKVLNDPVPELGLPEGTYAKLKLNYLNAGTGTAFAAHEVILKTFTGNRRPDLRKAIQDDSEFVWKTGRGRGELLTLKNAGKIVQTGAQSAWLPIQTGVAEWMGHTKVRRPNEFLITLDQVRQLQSKLQPGDILIERREWFLSNIGLPGFWSHAALYIGTPAQRRAFFTNAAVSDWVKGQGEASGKIEALLQSRFPEVYSNSLVAPEPGDPVRIIEAIGPGVSLTSLEHSAVCDSLAVLRPKLGTPEKARAVFRAFRYAGRPYDYNFDFSTDGELVCTELVYKSYEPGGGLTGLNFPIVEVLGRKVTPANELAKQFDAESGTPAAQYELVEFLDGQERQGRATEASVEVFRSTWKRPKWHVLSQ